jgi:flagellar assembly protein FliH
MKAPPELLEFSKPLREVRLRTGRPECRELVAARDLENAAFERGRREGEKALGEQLVRQRSELLELQNGVLRSVRDLLPQLAGECEKALVSLALDAAAKLVSGLAVTQDMMEGVIKESLARVEETHEITVFLHTNDLEMLQRANSPLVLSDAEGERIRFRTSPEVTRGGCIIQTRFGTIDARRETKLELLRRSLEV